MSIGKKFLERVLVEEVKGFAFDVELKGLKSRLKDEKGIKGTNVADVILEIANMLGVPAQVISKRDIMNSIVDSAETMKSNSAVVTVLNQLHQALLIANGVSSEESPSKQIKVSEATQTAQDMSDDAGGTNLKNFVLILQHLGIPADVLESGRVKSKLAAAVSNVSSSKPVKDAVRSFIRKAGLLSQPVKEANEFTSGQAPAEKALSNSPLVNDAVSVIKALGIDVFGGELVKNNKNKAIQMAILAAVRANPALRPAIQAFLSHTKKKGS